MSDYIYFLDQLRETERRIAHTEAALASDPSDRALEVNLRSLIAMRERLKQ